MARNASLTNTKEQTNRHLIAFAYMAAAVAISAPLLPDDLAWLLLIVEAMLFILAGMTAYAATMKFAKISQWIDWPAWWKSDYLATLPAGIVGEAMFFACMIRHPDDVGMSYLRLILYGVPVAFHVAYAIFNYPKPGLIPKFLPKEPTPSQVRSVQELARTWGFGTRFPVSAGVENLALRQLSRGEKAARVCSLAVFAISIVGLIVWTIAATVNAHHVPQLPL
ncbi:hypothetical protein KQI84_15200 [bacterium]|nr:hypothetical protein [bacterium]